MFSDSLCRGVRNWCADCRLNPDPVGECWRAIIVAGVSDGVVEPLTSRCCVAGRLSSLATRRSEQSDLLSYKEVVEVETWK